MNSKPKPMSSPCGRFDTVVQSSAASAYRARPYHVVRIVKGHTAVDLLDVTPHGRVLAVQWSPLGQYVVVYTDMLRACTFHVAPALCGGKRTTCSDLCVRVDSTRRTTYSAAWSSDETMAVFVTVFGEMRMFNLETGERQVVTYVPAVHDVSGVFVVNGCQHVRVTWNNGTQRFYFVAPRLVAPPEAAAAPAAEPEQAAAPPSPAAVAPEV